MRNWTIYRVESWYLRCFLFLFNRKLRRSMRNWTIYRVESWYLKCFLFLFNRKMRRSMRNWTIYRVKLIYLWLMYNWDLRRSMRNWSIIRGTVLGCLAIHKNFCTGSIVHLGISSCCDGDESVNNHFQDFRQKSVEFEYLESMEHAMRCIFLSSVQ